MNDEHRGSFAKNDIISGTASSEIEIDPSHSLNNIVGVTGDNVFHSHCCPNSKVTDGEWLEYDFKKLMVWPLHCTLRPQYNYGLEVCRPNIWVVNLSLNERNWEIGHRRHNDSQLKGANRIFGFEISREPGPFRYIRLRQTAPDTTSHLPVPVGMTYFWHPSRIVLT
jgi:hypothetical protein